MSPKQDTNLGTPDALNPEWDAYASAWAVNAADFGSPIDAAAFLMRRKRIFLEAQALGLDKELLTPFEPNRPGFETRVRIAFEKIASVAGLAAE